MEDGQASAYLVKTDEWNEQEQKQLLFTLPEHPKPKFLSKNGLL